ncbi:PREDICTED: DNA-directed RNA polymerase, partial [Prunus dulcis]
TETVDLSDQNSRSDGSRKYFMESNIERHRSIDSDGLPCVGQTIKPDEEYYSIYNEVNNEQHAVK